MLSIINSSSSSRTAHPGLIEGRGCAAEGGQVVGRRGCRAKHFFFKSMIAEPDDPLQPGPVGQPVIKIQLACL